MEINQSELSQHEFEKMLENLRYKRDSDKNSSSFHVYRIVESIKDEFYHDSFDLLEIPIDVILAEYGISDFLSENEKMILIADLFKIAEQKEFEEIARIVDNQQEEFCVDITCDSGECSKEEI